MEEFNYTYQDGTKLLSTSEKREATDTTPGIKPEANEELRAGLADAADKNTVQQVAIKFEQTCTANQDEIAAKCASLIGNFRNAAGSEYEGDRAMKNKFHVGSLMPKSVSSIMAELKYLANVSADKMDVFKKHGLTDADFANLTAFSGELEKADTDQEGAKSAQKIATKARDLALKRLAKAMRRIRRDAKIVFKNQPLTLIEFEKIPLPPPGRKPSQPGDGKNPPAK